MTSSRSRFSAFSILLAVAASAAGAACSSSTNGSQAVAPTDPTPVDATPIVPSTTPPLRAAIDPKIAARLEAAGVDVSKPGDLEPLLHDKTKLRAVMESFTVALGTTCSGCHAGSGSRLDYEAETPKKNIAKKMWSEFVVALEKKDGGAIYCDSCHQGKMKFLDRSDDRSLAAWMTENFVGKLARQDGKDHSCATCHGDPFNGDINGAFSK